MIDRHRVFEVNHRRAFDIRELVEWHGSTRPRNNCRTSARGFSIRNKFLTLLAKLQFARIFFAIDSRKMNKFLYECISMIYIFWLDNKVLIIL